MAVAFPLLGVLVFVLPHQFHLAFNAGRGGRRESGSPRDRPACSPRVGSARRARSLPLLAGTIPAAAYLRDRGASFPRLELHRLWLAAAFAILLARR